MHPEEQERGSAENSSLSIMQNFLTNTLNNFISHHYPSIPILKISFSFFLSRFFFFPSLSVCLPVCLPTYMSVCLFVCLSARLFVTLSVCYLSLFLLV